MVLVLVLALVRGEYGGTPGRFALPAEAVKNFGLAPPSEGEAPAEPFLNQQLAAEWLGRSLALPNLFTAGFRTNGTPTCVSRSALCTWNNGCTFFL